MPAISGIARRNTRRAAGGENTISTPVVTRGGESTRPARPTPPPVRGGEHTISTPPVVTGGESTRTTTPAPRPYTPPVVRGGEHSISTPVVVTGGESTRTTTPSRTRGGEASVITVPPPPARPRVSGSEGRP